jgi:hypothetical protein
MTKHTGKQIFVRLSDDLVAELDRYVEVLAREQPGLSPSRSDAIRCCCMRAGHGPGEATVDPRTRRPAARGNHGLGTHNDS